MTDYEKFLERKKHSQVDFGKRESELGRGKH
jgi:hypothetical protein